VLVVVVVAVVTTKVIMTTTTSMLFNTVETTFIKGKIKIECLLLHLWKMFLANSWGVKEAFKLAGKCGDWI